MGSKQKCHLFIETKIISPSGKVEKMKVESKADWMIQGDYLSIHYQEGTDEQLVTSQLRVSIQQNEMQLIRKGAVSFQHIFRENEEAESPYESPFGYIMYSTYTKKVQLELRNGKPDQLILQYDSAFNGERIGEFTVTHQFVEQVLPAQEMIH